MIICFLLMFIEEENMTIRPIGYSTVLWRLGQVQMPGNRGGIQRSTLSLSHTPDVLVLVDDG